MLAHLLGVVVRVEGVKRPLTPGAHPVLAGLDQRFQSLPGGLFVGLGLCGGFAQGVQIHPALAAQRLEVVAVWRGLPDRRLQFQLGRLQVLLQLRDPVARLLGGHGQLAQILERQFHFDQVFGGQGVATEVCELLLGVFQRRRAGRRLTLGLAQCRHCAEHGGLRL
ncbi:hypothetical protein D3C84_689960 [compost metagenome]